MTYTIHRLPKWDWRTGRFRAPLQSRTSQYVAATDLRAGMIVTDSPNGLIPANGVNANIVGIVRTAVRAGAFVDLIVYGENYKFQAATRRPKLPQ